MSELITPEVIAEMRRIRDDWAQVLVNTSRADRYVAEAAVKDCYTAAGVAPPKEIYWVQSPKQGVTLCAQWTKLNDMRPWGDPKLPEVSPDDILRALGISCYGQHDAGWHTFYEFLQQHLPEKIARLEPQRMLARSACWWWPYENGAIICERPLSVTVDDEGRLHSKRGAAILFEDGYAVYAYHGTIIPREATEDHRWITLDRLSSLTDVMQKRALTAMAPLAVSLRVTRD